MVEHVVNEDYLHNRERRRRKDNNELAFIGLLMILGGVFYFFFSPGPAILTIIAGGLIAYFNFKKVRKNERRLDSIDKKYFDKN